MKTRSILIFLFVSLIAFNSCKKYPKNYLWFSNVNSMLVKHWSLDSYKVGGGDSTNIDAMKMYIEKGVDFQDQSILYPEQYEGVWSLDKKKKHMSITTTNSGNFPSYITQINIFRGSINWTIEKLSKNEFWLSGDRGNGRVEVHLTQ
jgi:hypothetical protein